MAFDLVPTDRFGCRIICTFRQGSWYNLDAIGPARPCSVRQVGLKVHNIWMPNPYQKTCSRDDPGGSWLSSPTWQGRETGLTDFLCHYLSRPAPSPLRRRRMSERKRATNADVNLSLSLSLSVRLVHTGLVPFPIEIGARSSAWQLSPTKPTQALSRASSAARPLPNGLGRYQTRSTLSLPSLRLPLPPTL